MQISVGSGFWPSSIDAGEMTARDSSGWSRMSNQDGFRGNFQFRQSSLANQVVNVLTAGEWGCTYNS